MPKLPAASQAAAATAKAWEPGTREAWPDGRYLVYAADLEQKTPTGPDSSGVPYWNVSFKSPDKYEQPRGRVFEKISTGESSAGKQRAFFEAFGYTVDSDTSEFVGKADELCWVYVGSKPHYKDPNKTENEVLGWSPVLEGDELPPLRDES